jgi:1,4-alpha-glucan branching enzyme
MEIKGKTQWEEIYNSDSIEFWGTGKYMNETILCSPVDKKRKIYEINFNIPPLSAIVFR